jgi:hypothetical protein
MPRRKKLSNKSGMTVLRDTVLATAECHYCKPDSVPAVVAFRRKRACLMHLHLLKDAE